MNQSLVKYEPKPLRQKVADALFGTNVVSLESKQFYPSANNGWLPSLSNILRHYGSQIDYRSETGDLTQNSLVMAVVNCTATILPEATLQVVEYDKDGKTKIITHHKLSKLWERPTPYYSGETLMWFFSASWWIYGNVYFYKLKNARGEVVQLFPILPFMISPYTKTDSTSFIDYYEYRVNAKRYELPLEDIVHIRRGIDFNDMRVGVAAFDSLFRELYTDNKIANLKAALMKNYGIVPYAIIPKEGTVEESDARLQKEVFIKNSTGDNAGQPTFTLNPVEIVKLAFNPRELELPDLTLIPESRVAAVTRIPPSILYYMVGLVNGNAYASEREASAQLYKFVIKPIQTVIGSDLTVQLLPDFDSNKNLYVEFDYSDVAELQEDVDKKATRDREDWKADIITLDEVRAKRGYGEDENGLGEMRYSQLANRYVPIESNPPKSLNGFPLTVEGLKESLSKMNGMSPGEVLVAGASSNGHNKKAGVNMAYHTNERLQSIVDAATPIFSASTAKSFEFEGLSLNREPNEIEKIAVKSIAEIQESGKTVLAKMFEEIRETLIEEAVKVLPKLSSDGYSTFSFSLSQEDTRKIKGMVVEIYRLGAYNVAAELAEQKKSLYEYDSSKSVTPAADDELDELTSNTITRFLTDFTSKAIDAVLRLRSLKLKGQKLIKRLKEELNNLSSKPLESIASSTTNAALGLGRQDEMVARADEIGRYEFSCLLDKNLCSECEPHDGETAKSLEDLMPVPLESCEGGALCRCFIVAVSI